MNDVPNPLDSYTDGELLAELRKRGQCAILIIDHDDLYQGCDDAGIDLTEAEAKDLFPQIASEVEDRLFDEVAFRLRRMVVEVAMLNGLIPDLDDEDPS